MLNRDKSGCDDQYQVDKANNGRNNFKLADLQKHKRKNHIHKPKKELADGEIAFVKQEEPIQRKNKHPDLARVKQLRKDYKNQFGSDT